MTLRKAHLYLLPLDRLRNVVLGELLREAQASARKRQSLPIRIDDDVVEHLRELDPLLCVEGPLFVELTLGDFDGLTLKQTELQLAKILIEPFCALNSYSVGRMVGRREDDIRRLRKRPYRANNLLRHRWSCAGSGEHKTAAAEGDVSVTASSMPE